jgi:SAM-dependent methyltransferase
MREKDLQRLNYTHTNIKDPYYLGYKYLFTDVQNAIDQHATGDLLDIGCGNKPYELFFQGKINSYIGCDVVQSDQNKVDIICFATDIPLPDNSKNTVFTTQVIEHVADHKKLLSEAYRILKPGGKIILSGPMCWEHHEVPYDFFRFTRYGFEYLMQETGFKDIYIKANGGKWAMVGQILLNSMRSSMEKKTFPRRVFSFFYFLFRIKWLINVFFSWLDRVDMDESATLNFVVVAKK